MSVGIVSLYTAVVSVFRELWGLDFAGAGYLFTAWQKNRDLAVEEQRLKTAQEFEQMLPSARAPGKLIRPSYQFQYLGEGRYAAFRFRSYAGTGTIDRDRQVLKIDYDSAENPDFLIRDILDELVEIVPRVYLGKILVRFSEHIRWLGAYFALRPPAPGSL